MSSVRVTDINAGYGEHVRRNNEGKYHCPVTFKVFTENTHITAVATTGNVYAYEALQRLNIEVFLSPPNRTCTCALPNIQPSCGSVHSAASTS